eukprot:365336-Chlamydomonas_euryale.AAC.13
MVGVHLTSLDARTWMAAASAVCNRLQSSSSSRRAPTRNSAPTSTSPSPAVARGSSFQGSHTIKSASASAPMSSREPPVALRSDGGGGGGGNGGSSSGGGPSPGAAWHTCDLRAMCGACVGHVRSMHVACVRRVRRVRVCVCACMQCMHEGPRASTLM